MWFRDDRSFRDARRPGLLAVTASVLLSAACSASDPPRGSYYDDRIAPILQVGCVMQTTGCHLVNDRGTAAGNLDLTSYDALMRRRDTLPRFGPYPMGTLLMKVAEPVEITVNTVDPPDPSQPNNRTVTIRTDIRHNAGAGIAVSSTGFAQLREWINAGHARQGSGEEHDDGPVNSESCVSGLGVNDFEINRFQSQGPIDDPVAYQRFVDQVQPVLRANCSSTFCHGDRLRSLYLTCGDTEEEKRWNFFVSTWHIATPTTLSELLRRPLAMDRGGDFHVGGDVFESADDPGYLALRGWIEDLVARSPQVLIEDYATEGFRYFVNRVQPVLVRKGCLFQNCHSHISQNQDLQLFVGSQGTFGRAAQHRNHGAGLGLLGLESPDPNQSRIVAKNLFPPEQVTGGQGIAHRGGSLLEDFPGELANTTLCADYDADNGDLNEVPAYCIFARWHEIERGIAEAQAIVLPEAIASIVWVSRPLDIGEPTDFDTYRPGANLHIAAATRAADGSISLGPTRSLLAGCSLDQATADVRGPAVSWDGTRIAFAARTSAAEPLRLFWMNDDGSSCVRVPGVAPDAPMENGILLHDFDPSFAPDGQLVFASTRGPVDRSTHDYGASRTPAAMQPNANLYVFSELSEPPVRQLTFLLDQEISPSFTSVGRVVYVGEKRHPGFHQLSARQQNLDGGDFRPAFGARDSVGFNAATEPVQLITRDLAFVAAPLHNPQGAGSIVVANQSLGVDEAARDAGDRFYLRAMHRPVSDATSGGRGVFRSPAALPSRFILASCDLDATSLDAGPFDFDLCLLDPSRGTATVLVGDAGRAEIEAVGVFPRYVLPSESIVPSDGEKLDRPTMESRLGTDALVTFHDFPMQVGLLFNNTRNRRVLPTGIEGFDVLEALPPPPEAQSFADVAGNVVNDEFGSMYVRRRRLGHVDLLPDASAAVRIPGGIPIVWRPTDGSGRALSFGADDLFPGVSMTPREADQYYPGEHSRRAFPRHIFNKVCGWCHAGASGRELDVSVSIDVLTGASRSAASRAEPVNLSAPPADRGPIEGP